MAAAPTGSKAPASLDGGAGSAVAVSDAASPGVVGRGNRRDLGSTRSLVLAGDRLVVTIGLDDVIVVDTPDALLICAAERSQDVRTISQQIIEASRKPVPDSTAASRKDEK